MLEDNPIEEKEANKEDELDAELNALEAKKSKQEQAQEGGDALDDLAQKKSTKKKKLRSDEDFRGDALDNLAESNFKNKSQVHEDERSLDSQVYTY